MDKCFGDARRDCGGSSRSQLSPDLLNAASIFILMRLLLLLFSFPERQKQVGDASASPDPPLRLGAAEGEASSFYLPFALRRCRLLQTAATDRCRLYREASVMRQAGVTHCCYPRVFATETRAVPQVRSGAQARISGWMQYVSTRVCAHTRAISVERPVFRFVSA